MGVAGSNPARPVRDRPRSQVRTLPVTARAPFRAFRGAACTNTGRSRPVGNAALPLRAHARERLQPPAGRAAAGSAGRAPARPPIATWPCCRGQPWSTPGGSGR